MDAQAYYELNQILASLSTSIQHQRYTGQRTGQIPPAEMAKCLTDVGDHVRQIKAVLVRNGTNLRIGG